MSRDSADAVVIGAGHNGLMSIVSPALQALRLDDHGLRWTHALAVVGHPQSDLEAGDGPRGWPRRRLTRAVMSLARREVASTYDRQ